MEGLEFYGGTPVDVPWKDSDTKLLPKLHAWAHHVPRLTQQLRDKEEKSVTVQLSSSEAENL